ncbi:Plasmodium vivax Vir protein, putative [Plasmodium vivax]|nr:Plasmodium vivax Vir protein, putative [Plasmodium vivax]
MSSIIEREWDENDALYTGKFYDELERSHTPPQYDIYCGSRDTPVHGKREVRNICATILNYLETTYSASNHTGDAYDVCKLLNYWVFSRLSEIYVSDNTSTAKDAFDTLDRIWNQFIKEKGRELDIKKCRPDRVLFSYNDWKKRKELYDYYVDIGPIVQFAKSISHDCDQYYKYVKYKKKIYDQYEEYCKQDNYLKCPNFFKDCIKYNPKDVLPMFNCYLQMEQRELSRDKASQAQLANTSPEAPPLLLSNPEIPDPNTSTGTKAGNAFLGVVVTSMTSGALYKFTPLGSMLRNRFGRNNHNMRNLKIGDNGLFDYVSESFNPYSGEEHYIGYQPA